jgi:radical SAM superfamily enzyme YgiQ (UPF0313 family)
MRKLLLVNPVGRRSGYLLSKFSRLPPLGLAYVAAVTPAGGDVKISDENFDEFNFEKADLVGIGAFTSNIVRAYEIAEICKKRNVKVIMGGIHPSMCPDEALRYADTVVVGEAESIWPQIIADFENKCLKPKYTSNRVDLSRCHVKPRRDLLHPDYLWASIQTSRGCPLNCDFCSVSRYLGREYRQRSVTEILDELRQIGNDYIAFLDDNLIGYSAESKARAMQLFEGMTSPGFRKKWWMQTSINAADDEQLVKLAAQAGCVFAFLGFETIREATLNDMKKRVNLRIGAENYKKVIDSFHQHGIAVFGAFIIGNDYESTEYYEQLAEFLVHSGIDIVQISILTPLPGTDLMERLEKEGRLIYEDSPQNWDKYRFSSMVHKPKGLEISAVYEGNNYIKRHIYSFPIYQYRLIRSLFNLKRLSSFFATYKFNQALKKSWQNAHYYNRHFSNET